MFNHLNQVCYRKKKAALSNIHSQWFDGLTWLLLKRHLKCTAISKY